MRGIRASEATLSVRGQRDAYGERQRKGWREKGAKGRMTPRHASLPPRSLRFFPTFSSLTAGFAGVEGERGRGEDHNRVIGTKSRGTFSDIHRMDEYAHTRYCEAHKRAQCTSDTCTCHTRDACARKQRTWIRISAFISTLRKENR